MMKNKEKTCLYDINNIDFCVRKYYDKMYKITIAVLETFGDAAVKRDDANPCFCQHVCRNETNRRGMTG